ncbi:MAG: AmpG family muropeptide MFS transporter [Myxococcota bacterium]|jgi:PAT family beta-lactamase induction signal transducer AmpG|nr:AmpG family muropeptide MFS transporter [Myxococcota bacterium]
MSNPTPQWRQSLAVYAQARMLLVLILGFSSGLPLALTLSTLNAWLTEDGISLTAIGLFSMVGLPYAFKFVWAPLIDHLRIPILTQRLGRRRSWAIFSQLGLMLAIVGLGQSNPAQFPLLTAACALAVAFFSASQDIVIDALRVELLSEREQGAGAATIVLGYRLGMLVSGAGALVLASYLSWSLVFSLMAAFVLLGMGAALWCKEPADTSLVPEEPLEETRRPSPFSGVLTWLRRAVVDPFAEFSTRRSWLLVLLFIAAYKLGDSLAGVMSMPFYLQLGFSKTEIAGVTKVFGLIATLAGGVVGGVLVTRFGIWKSLLLCGILQAVSNLLFAVQAQLGHHLGMLTVTIAFENAASGMGAAAFVAYLSGLCNLRFTATQYALLSSLAATGRTLMASPGGWLAEQMSWQSFFVLTTFAALPGLLLLLYLRPKEGAPETTKTQKAETKKDQSRSTGGFALEAADCRAQ